MIQQSYATGHGDTIEDLLKHLDWQARDYAHKLEREAIMDEWHACVQADLEHGVRSLNERAAEKWHKEYPAIAGFAEAIRARSEK